MALWGTPSESWHPVLVLCLVSRTLSFLDPTLQLQAMQGHELIGMNQQSFLKHLFPHWLNFRITRGLILLLLLKIKETQAPPHCY